VPDGYGVGYFGRQLLGHILGAVGGGLIDPRLAYPGRILGGAGLAGEYLERAHRKTKAKLREADAGNKKGAKAPE
jgi:hypothetical protein